MQKILVVDDEADIRRAFRRLFEAPELHVLEAGTPAEALTVIAQEQPDLVCLDIRLGAANGLELLRKLRQLNPRLLVLMMTAYGTTHTAIEAMKLGAYDYVLKPFDVPQLKTVITSALKAARDMREVVSYQPLLDKEDYAAGIVGKSAAMQEVFKRIGQVAPTDATVLITGESGTGKELVARAIYHHSARVQQPFLAINCAAIPENLLESELFGHEKGAFTGAGERRIGKFEQCDGGTIFLDEIGDMPLATQTKILRVLQNGEFQRVGGNQTIRVNVRVLAATNKNPEQLIAEKKFREDLYYRLNVMRIHLPPLRERPEDIPVLVDYFLQKAGKRPIAPEALALLQRYPWPGNVRELENVIQRALVVARSDRIRVEDLPAEVSEGRPPLATPSPETVAKTVDEAVAVLFDLARRDPQFRIIASVERELIARALQTTGGNQVHAAKLLGITRATLRKRIEKYGIERRLEVS
ncbi:MAG: sigma-54 dependent transcriptional regulator [Verrucomicrobiae bacterium]|nr:sigma-54 dependent transcriptional regulator [Verrucomicrobiae bacterium]MDW8342965.1 sigma-54 dependent transcriptional regulator [Verrucomicrobiae bacterium]